LRAAPFAGNLRDKEGAGNFENAFYNMDAVLLSETGHAAEGAYPRGRGGACEMAEPFQT
jgi:hypothetical protein